MATTTKKFDLPFGKAVIIRTVTYHFTGKLEGRANGFLFLSDAAWIADTGRWADALKSGKLSEVEPYPDTCMVSEACVVDIAEWNHALPREQK